MSALCFFLSLKKCLKIFTDRFSVPTVHCWIFVANHFPWSLFANPRFLPFIEISCKSITRSLTGDSRRGLPSTAAGPRPVLAGHHLHQHRAHRARPRPRRLLAPLPSRWFVPTEGGLRFWKSIEETCWKPSQNYVIKMTLRGVLFFRFRKISVFQLKILFIWSGFGPPFHLILSPAFPPPIKLIWNSANDQTPSVSNSEIWSRHHKQAELLWPQSLQLQSPLVYWWPFGACLTNIPFRRLRWPQKTFLSIFFMVFN